MDLSEYPPKYHMALRLLIPLWRGLDSSYKRKYARSIWQQFEDNIKAAAYASSASRFFSNICSRMAIAVDAAGLDDIRSALSLGVDAERALLRQLRDETSTLVLMVRIENEKRKIEWDKKRSEEEQE